MKKMQMNTKLASIIIDLIHEENLPITISTGEKLDDEMIDVLVESDEEGLFSTLLNETINNNLLNFTEQRTFCLTT